MRTVIVDILDVRDLIARGVRFEAVRVLDADGHFKWSVTTYA
jgi:hypothetical protein